MHKTKAAATAGVDYAREVLGRAVPGQGSLASPVTAAR